MTCEAVTSVLREPDVTEVVVVDNASGDGSAEYVRCAVTDPRLRVIESATNRGFGPGVNLGVASCHSPLLLMLNSDAQVRPGSVELLVTALSGDDSVGVIAPAVLRADGRGAQPNAFGRLPHRWEVVLCGPWATSRSGDQTRVQWVSGVAMLLRTADFRSLGGFDEDFDMYFEDVDLCRRIRARGQTVRRLPVAEVVHGGGRSWRSSAEKRRRYHSSRLVYARKLGATSAELRLISATGRLKTALAARSDSGSREPTSDVEDDVGLR